jgi:ABC-2 type transport system ATP-binding protein
MRAIVSRLVHQARSEERTVIFSSHVLAEVEEVSDRVAILCQGRLVHLQNMSELRKQHRIRASISSPLPPPPALLRDQLSIRSGDGGRITIDVQGELSPLLGWLATLALSEIRVEPIGLRAVYDQYHANTAAAGNQQEARP